MNKQAMGGSEMQDTYDPMSDPEEQRLMVSVLDSFRYIPVTTQHMTLNEFTQ